MPEIKVYQDQDKATRGIVSWSFTVDGIESLYWSPTEHAIRRVISRLSAGRSMEAFGGTGLVAAAGATVAAATRGARKRGRGNIVRAGDVVTETVEMKSGRQKVREKRPGFVYELDGKAHEIPFTSDTDAKGACAWAAFKTRGRLGRFAEAEAAFKELFGQECKVHLFGRKVVAKAADGSLWSVGIFADEPVRFKKVVPAIPK